MKTKEQKQKDLEPSLSSLRTLRWQCWSGFERLTVAKDQELRNQLREVGVTYERCKEHACPQGS